MVSVLCSRVSTSGGRALITGIRLFCTVQAPWQSSPLARFCFTLCAKGPLYSCPSLIPNSSRSTPHRALGDFHTTIFKSAHLLRIQPQPQTTRSNATRNIRKPTGKMATMKIASPSASAQMPRQHQFLHCPHGRTSFPSRLMLQYIPRGVVPCPRAWKSGGSPAAFASSFAAPLPQVLELVVEPQIARVPRGGRVSLPAQPPERRSPFPSCGCSRRSGSRPDRGAKSKRSPAAAHSAQTQARRYQRRKSRACR